MFDLGGCWLSEVNIAIMDGQGLYLSIFMSYRKFLGDKSSKQVASIMNVTRNVLNAFDPCP